MLAAYERLAAADPGRWRRIDADARARARCTPTCWRRSRRAARGARGVSARWPAPRTSPRRGSCSAAALEGEPSHAYLFHGPPGTGKRTAPRAFAAELLAEGQPDPDGVRRACTARTPTSPGSRRRART